MGGAAVAAFAASTLNIGKTYESTLNNLQAVSNATAKQMSEVAREAKALGSDLTLTSTSAADAATAMTELAKGGLTVDEAMKAARGTLQLAAAAGIQAGQAAEIQSAALNAFNLEANQAGRVADVLANAANAAAGEITDFGQGMAQASAVAAATGISLEDTAATLGILANNGIKGSDAGTLLKSALLALQSPSRPAAKAMSELSLSAYDAAGNFVGLSSVFGQLERAQKSMTPQAYAAATSTLFGSDAARLAGIAGREGAAGFDRMAEAMGKSGSAADVAAAKAKGVGGAIEAFVSQLETFQIDLYEKVAPSIEKLIRFAAEALSKIASVAGFAIDAIVALATPLGTLAGFLMDNEEVALALAAAIGVYLVGGIAALQVAINSFVITPVVLGLSSMLGALDRLPTSFAAARAAVAGFVASFAPLVAVGAVVYGITKVIEFGSAAGDARNEVRQMWSTLEDARGVEQVGAASELVDQLATKVRSLNDELPKTEGAMQGFLGPLGMFENGAALNGLSEYERALAAARKEQELVTGTAEALGERFKLTSDEVLELAGKYDIDLSGSLTESRRLFENFYTTEFGTTPTDAANATGAAMTSAKQQTEDAAKALEDWLTELQDTAAGFIEPLGAYTGLLTEKQEADRKTAEATAAATESSKDSWQDYVTDVTVTFEEYKTRLLEQVTAQNDWQRNMLILAGRVSAGTLQELSRMGPEGAPLIADLVNRSDAELAELEPIMAQRSENATGAWAAQLTQAGPVLAAIGRTAGAGVVAELAAQLEAGTVTVAEIAARYGLNLAGGINPILSGLGRPPIYYNPRTGARNMTGFQVNADGNLYENHQAEIARAGAWRVWAEPETGGEAYIPLAASKRSRSLNIWRETGKRLQAPEVQYFAFGGVNDVPRPPSTSPYRVPISTAADASMQKGYDETTAWLRANVETVQGGLGGGPAGSGAVGGAWQSIFNYVKARIPQVRINSSYRPGDPGYHGRAKAVDMGFGTGPGGAGSAGLASIKRVLHDGIGSNLAELIYSGIGNDRPNLKNGRPLNYGAKTDAEHRNHVHAAVFDSGGVLAPGMTGVNRSGKPEAVFNNEQWAVLQRIADGGPRGPIQITGVLEIGGDGLARIVDGRIEERGARQGVNFRSS